MIIRKTNGVSIHSFSALAERHRLLHGFSGRGGGVSQGGYASLNLGLHVGDDPALVLENRRRFCRAAGIDLGRLVVGEQVHGGSVCTVTQSDAGRGAREHESSIAGADALVSNQPGVPLMALSADCPLVVMFDPEAPAAAVVHAGWRSIAARILTAAVKAMAALGAAPGRLLAGIGPAAGRCCYDVRADFIRAMETAERHVARREGRTFFDLEGAASDELQAAGVPAGSIHSACLCTCCHADAFYSARASGGRTGRFGAFVCMSE